AGSPGRRSPPPQAPGRRPVLPPSAPGSRASAGPAARTIGSWRECRHVPHARRSRPDVASAKKVAGPALFADSFLPGSPLQWRRENFPGDTTAMTFIRTLAALLLAAGAASAAAQ